MKRQTRPWKTSPMARTCAYCKTQRPGMQPLRLTMPDGAIRRGYWHLACFEKERAAIKKAAKPGGLKSRE